MVKQKVQKDGNDCDTESTAQQLQNPLRKHEKSSWNYSAIFLMMLFILPGIIAAFMGAYDLAYPEAKAHRIVREKVARCYEAANPIKLNEVDKIVGKYKGKEHVLFAQLRAKYGKHPEC